MGCLLIIIAIIAFVLFPPLGILLFLVGIVVAVMDAANSAKMVANATVQNKKAEEIAELRGRQRRAEVVIQTAKETPSAVTALELAQAKSELKVASEWFAAREREKQVKVISAIVVVALVIGWFAFSPHPSSNLTTPTTTIRATVTPSSEVTPKMIDELSTRVPTTSTSPTTEPGKWTAEDEKQVFGAKQIQNPLPLLSNEEATAAFNMLQDRLNKPHAKSVTYDKKTDSYVWIGPVKGKKMSMPRVQFENEIITPYIKATK